MTQMEIQAPSPMARNGYKVDISRGQRIGRVSSEWFNRPADERYLSLTDLHNTVKRRSERSKTRIVESEAIRVEAARDNPERLMLMLPAAPAPVAPTHWSFGQLTSLVGAPATYLEIGDRTRGDEGSYPDDDLVAVMGADGKWAFTRKDGTPY